MEEDNGPVLKSLLIDSEIWVLRHLTPDPFQGLDKAAAYVGCFYTGVYLAKGIGRFANTAFLTIFTRGGPRRPLSVPSASSTSEFPAWPVAVPCVLPWAIRRTNRSSTNS